MGRGATTEGQDPEPGPSSWQEMWRHPRPFALPLAHPQPHPLSPSTWQVRAPLSLAWGSLMGTVPRETGVRGPGRPTAQPPLLPPASQSASQSTNVHSGWTRPAPLPQSCPTPTPLWQAPTSLCPPAVPPVPRGERSFHPRVQGTGRPTYTSTVDGLKMGLVRGGGAARSRGQGASMWMWNRRRSQ